MSMLDRNEPKMTGQPGRISWASAMPDSASASCCTSAAGMVTGDIAPISRNGVSTTGWLAAQYSNWASSIRSSQRSGELQLISEIVAGVGLDRAPAPPNRISVILMVSAAFGPGHHVAHVDLVGQGLQRVDHVQVPGVERRVVRLADHPAGRVQLRERLGQHAQPPEVVQRGVPPDVALADERRAVHRAEHHLVAADVHVVRRVAGLHVELPRRLGHLLQHELGVEEDHLAVHLLAGLAEQLHRLRLGELHPDLRDDPPPALVQHADRVGGQDLVARHRVAEHRHLSTSPPVTCPVLDRPSAPT